MESASCFTTWIPKTRYFWKAPGVLVGERNSSRGKVRGKGNAGDGKIQMIYMKSQEFEEEMAKADVDCDNPMMMGAWAEGTALSKSLLLLRLVYNIVRNHDGNMIGFTSQSVFLKGDSEVFYVDYDVPLFTVMEAADAVGFVPFFHFAPEIRNGNVVPGKALVYAIGEIMFDLMGKESGDESMDRQGLFEVLARLCVAENERLRPTIEFVLLCLTTGLFVIQSPINVSEFKTHVADLEQRDRYFFGKLREINNNGMVNVWEESANPDALCLLGFMHQYGFTVMKSNKFATYYKRSPLNIAKVALEMAGVRNLSDLKGECREIVSAAQTAGSVQAKVILAVADNASECDTYMSLHRCPSELQVSVAMRLADYYTWQDSDVPDSVLYALTGAANARHPRASYKAGLLYLKMKSYDMAKRYLEAASADGDMDARYKLLELEKDKPQLLSTGS